MRMRSHGANYVSSIRWATVLDSISELKDHYKKKKEEAAGMLAAADYVPRSSPGPRLLYEPVRATEADIPAFIPARPVVDRLVSRYINAYGVASAADASLLQYESFWQEPAATPFTSVGLLFSVICLATQYQQLIEDPVNPDTLMRVHVCRERSVHSLVPGQFTRRDTHVLETMINHCASEVFMCKDADIGLWFLLGMLDPRNFPNISPFTGEMRRRVWPAIMRMDLRVASQVGLPRLLKSHPCGTSEPQNLFDSHFDEATVEVPPSRPETENRIDGIGRMISDLIADTREHSYPEIMELDQKLQEANGLLPHIFRWGPLSCCAAIKTLEFQHRVSEETQPPGQLHPMRWITTSDVPLDSDTDTKIHTLLRNTYPLWLRSSNVLGETREAVKHLSLMVGLRDEQETLRVDEAVDGPITPRDSGISCDQVSWDAYQGNNDTPSILIHIRAPGSIPRA
ncbi:fungal-specific transcription factor domain protein [Hypoxylon sp. NC0597]|nr:fungal-specific transcription factor domain protein [Hypoxylon sp. NC0597]